MSDAPLVDVIVRAVLAQLHLAEPEPPCACHSVPGGCCPDRLGLMLGHGAERFGLQAGSRLYPREIARLIELGIDGICTNFPDRAIALLQAERRE